MAGLEETKQLLTSPPADSDVAVNGIELQTEVAIVDTDTKPKKDGRSDNCKIMFSKLRTFKSMENFSKVSEDEDTVLLDHALSKSSNHIAHLCGRIVDIHKQLKHGSDQCKRIGSLSFDSSRQNRCHLDESSSFDDTPTVQMHLKHGQIIVSEPTETPKEEDNLAKIFRYVNSESRYETSQSSESIICRICHSSGDERLITPCKCAGSTQFVHATCLVTWFKKSVKNQCELCRSDVKVRKINHKLKLWRKPEDRPVPLIWFSVFFVGLFLNILSIYVNASEYCKSTACLIFYVVNGFGIILDAVFLWFWFMKCRHYWKKWCALNQDWFIVDGSDDPVVKYVQSV